MVYSLCFFPDHSALLLEKEGDDSSFSSAIIGNTSGDLRSLHLIQGAVKSHLAASEDQL